MPTVIGSRRAMRPNQSTPLSDDWSPAEIWLAIGDERSYELQLGIDAFKARWAGGTCEHNCEEHDDLAEAYLLREVDVIKAINGTKGLSGAARKRLLVELGIDSD